MASDSDIGTPILSLKNHERPKKVTKANEGQRRPKKSKIPKTCNFINIQCKTINYANALLENVDFYVKEKFQFYTMIMHILEKRPKH